MMPPCYHQNWLQRRLNRHCWRPAKHLHECNTGQLAGCDRHYKWFEQKLLVHMQTEHGSTDKIIKEGENGRN